MDNKIKVFLTSLIFMSYIGVSNAGSGAGGAITFVNDTNEDMHITWSAVGCAGINADLTFVCQASLVAKHDSKNYKYNWGVTDTWLNVGLHKQYSHPCSSGKAKNSDCKFEHYIVGTTAWKTDICTIKKWENEHYSITCIRS